MSDYNESGRVTWEADEAIPAYSRVVREADGKIVVAGIDQIGDGIAMQAAHAAGDRIGVKIWNSAGSFPMIASEAFALGATLYTEANGKVQDTAASTSFKFAVADQAATADGDIVKCRVLLAPGVTAEA